MMKPSEIRRKVLQHYSADTLVDVAMDSERGMLDSGICVECGNEQGGCEPDARGYRCDDCGAMAVYGVEELVLCCA